MRSLIKETIIIICIMMGCFSLAAQTVLERKVTLVARQLTLPEVLKKIEENHSLFFSYNPADLNTEKRFTVNYNQTALRVILSDLFEGSGCDFKAKGNYIIITSSGKNHRQRALNGYVYNLTDSCIIEEASIYLPTGKKVAISNHYGYFSLKTGLNDERISINISKEFFRDTTLIIHQGFSHLIKIYLKPNLSRAGIKPPVPIPIPTDAMIPVTADPGKVKEMGIFERMFFQLRRIRPNYLNIKDTLYSSFSFSVIPYLSTNRLLSVNTINRISINLLFGVSKGTTAIEAGGLVNVNNGNVSFLQMAGLGNVVTDTLRGVQFGGIFNVNGKYTKGFIAAGLFNITPQMKGFEAAGIFNINSIRSSGFTAAGLFNVTPVMKGVQVAGLFNVANKADGIQIAGLFNRARQLNGFQLGLINFADSCSGVPLGLLSFVRKGYHKLDLNYNDLSFFNLSYRTGVYSFHNILQVGYSSAYPGWLCFGYGIGSSISMGKRVYWTNDITSAQYQPVSFLMPELMLINRIQSMIEIQITKNIIIGAGPNINVSVSGDSQFPFESSIVNASDYVLNGSGAAWKVIARPGLSASLKLF